VQGKLSWGVGRAMPSACTGGWAPRFAQERGDAGIPDGWSFAL